MLRAFRRIRPIIRHDAQQRRVFFNFTDFSSVGPVARNESGNQIYHERKIVPYQRSELYTIIADVESYSNFLPYCTGSRILQSKARPDGLMVMEAELTVGFLAFKESYVSTVTCKPDQFVEAVAASSSLFKTLTTVWRLHPVSATTHQLSTPCSQENSSPSIPLDQESTLVTLDVAFAFANPMHTTVSATFFGQLSKLMIKAFEQRCVALYGPRTD